MTTPIFTYPVPQVADGWPREIWDTFNASRRAGYNPNYSTVGDPSGHDGEDLKAAYASNILSASNSVIHDTDFLNAGAGHGVETVERTDDGFNGEAGYWAWRYLHMIVGSMHHEVGDTVEAGEVIGQIGLTGSTRYPHLHVALKWIPLHEYDSAKGLVSQGVWLNPADYYHRDPQRPDPDPVELVTITIRRPVLRITQPPYTKDRAVQDLQHHLNSLGLMDRTGGVNDRTGGVNYDLRTGDWDGQHGPSTDTSVKEFQTLESLTVDGIVGKATWESLLGY